MTGNALEEILEVGSLPVKTFRKTGVPVFREMLQEGGEWRVTWHKLHAAHTRIACCLHVNSQRTWSRRPSDRVS